MSLNKTQLIADFGFIVAEAQRLKALHESGKNKEALEEQGMTAGLPTEHAVFPKTIIPITTKGQERLIDVASMILKNSQELKGRVQASSLARIVSIELAQRV